MAGRALPWWLLIGCVAAVALSARLWLMLRGGGLLSVGAYDDGVYYAAADALVHGRLPYRDFLLLQPPGIVVATAPFAWLGSITTDAFGFMAARVGFMVVGTLSTVLVATILRRFGYSAAAFGGLFYAVTYTAVYSERSILLEPMGTLGVLVALAVLDRTRAGAVRAGTIGGRLSSRWILVAGIALGVAIGFKIWYIVPAAVIVVFFMRSWLRLIVGIVIGAGALYLPFFVMAPAAMFREVVLDQLGRGRAGVTLPYRIQIILGDEHVPDSALKAGFTTRDLTLILAALSAIAFVIVLSTRGARLFAALLAADSLVLIASPSYFLHYAGLTTPMLALVVGVAVGRIAAVPPWRSARIAIACLAVAGTLAVNVHDERDGVGTRVPIAGLRRAAADVHGCVIADDPTILPVMNVLSRDLVDGCPLWPDVSGWTYDVDSRESHGVELPRPDNPAWQRRAVGYLTSGAAVILLRPATGLSAASKATIEKGPVLFREGPWLLSGTPRHR